MEVKVHTTKVLIAVIATVMSFSAFTLPAQDIASIAKSDPLIITGAIGTQNTFYSSNAGMAFSSQWSNSVYANLNFNIYGLSMPFSFYYTNDNASFSLPQVSFNISPTYKGWTLHLGKRSMPFSSYVFSMPFNGVGLEYSKSGKRSVRFGAFYGVLQQAINYEQDDIASRNPQYRRTGWGLKVGYGSNRSYLDLYLFRAKDQLSSIDECWYDKVDAKENIAVGARGRLDMGSHLSLSANFATSLFSTDIRTRTVESDFADKYSNIFDVRYSSLFRWAGDVALNMNFGRVSAAATYRLVQPDYTSLGIAYTSNNYQSLGLSLSTHFGTLMLSGSFSGQGDNLSGDQLYTTRGYVYNGNANWTLGSNFSINAGYNGYLQRQYDGAAQVNDTTRVNRIMHSWSLAPQYTILQQTIDHTISLSANYTRNEDLNAFSTGESDVNTMAVGVNYNMMVKPIETNFALNVSLQNTDGYNTKYDTKIYSFSTSRAFLTSRALSTSMTLSLTQNHVEGQVSNLSLGGSASASYTFREVHQFGISASYNRYASTNLILDGNQDLNTSFSVSANYNYTFAAFHLKHRAEKGAKRVWESDFVRSHNPRFLAQAGKVAQAASGNKAASGSKPKSVVLK